MIFFWCTFPNTHWRGCRWKCLCLCLLFVNLSAIPCTEWVFSHQYIFTRRKQYYEWIKRFQFTHSSTLICTHTLHPEVHYHYHYYQQLSPAIKSFDLSEMCLFEFYIFGSKIILQWCGRSVWAMRGPWPNGPAGMWTRMVRDTWLTISGHVLVLLTEIVVPFHIITVITSLLICSFPLIGIRLVSNC